MVTSAVFYQFHRAALFTLRGDSKTVDPGWQESLRTTLEVGCHDSADNPCHDLGQNSKGRARFESMMSLPALTVSSSKQESNSVKERVNVLTEAFFTESNSSARAWPSS